MKITAIVPAIVLIVSSAQAQQYRSPRPSKIISPSRELADTLLRPAQPADSLTRIIVEFREEPLFTPAPGVRKSEATYQGIFGQFASDLGTSGVRLSAPGVRSAPFARTFTKTFFGATLTVPASQLSDILKLPYVKAVHIDRRVKATLEKSALQMGVPQVWQTFGTQGDSIRVGIIDTGIDYLHPALGGGFGPTFKVAGGYDFVNNDTDPIDDEGHGTHVAGIVAADTDSIKGIAPKATLFAYKVLDQDGSGFESDVIAAIERAADPDNNGDPADRLDVVNLSLGTDMGSSTDPSAVAVNNASQLGVLFCIAAGNSGYQQSNHMDNYFRDGSATVGSPGTAELAVTVGAVDSLDVLAPFSSKGPNRHAFGIKPDVVAPGVEILSSVPGGAYDSYNGTSMATPMVTGVAALLKAAHPDWENARIKSALVNTAKDIGISAFHQGGGRVQALKAASSSAWIRPALLSFGFDDPALSLWTRQETLYVHNAHASSQTFASSVTGLQGGITVSVSPSGFTTLPGDSSMVIVSLSVDNSAITIQENNITRYHGRIRFAGTADTLTAPWAFAQGSRLRLVFNEPTPDFLIYGGPVFFLSRDPSVYWPTLTTAEIYGQALGTFGFMTTFHSPSAPGKMIIKENTISSHNQTIAINSTEATIPLVYQGVDHTGTPISTYPSPRKVLLTTIPQFGDWTTIFTTTSDTVFTSPVPETYVFRPLEYEFDASSGKTFHIIQYPSFNGIQSGKTFANSANDFVSQKFLLNYPPTASEAIIVGEFYTYREFQGPLTEGLLAGMGYEIDTVALTGGRVQLTGYFGRSADSTKDAAVILHTLSDLSTTKLDFSTLPIMVSKDSILAITKDDATTTTLRSPSGGEMSFGGPPPHTLALWYNNVFGQASLHFSANFRGMQRESRFKDLDHGTYTVYDSLGNVAFSNPLNDFPRAPRGFTPHRYKTVMTSANHWLGPLSGEVKLTSEFNLASSPANPPSFTSFQVLNAQGQPTDRVPTGSAATLLFSALTINFIDEALPVADSTRAWYRLHGTAEWIPLILQNIANDLAKEGSVFKADLSPATALDSAAIDLRVLAKDSRGFYADQEVSPAFGVGAWMGNFPSGVKEEVRTLPTEFALHQNYPNPFNPETAVSYQLPASAGTAVSVVRLRIYDMLGRVVATLVDGEMPAGVHRATWDASRYPSGIYFLHMETGGFRATRKIVLVR